MRDPACGDGGGAVSARKGAERYALDGAWGTGPGPQFRSRRRPISGAALRVPVVDPAVPCKVIPVGNVCMVNLHRQIHILAENT